MEIYTESLKKLFRGEREERIKLYVNPMGILDRLDVMPFILLE